MTGILWGFSLIFLDFSLTFGIHEIGLLPDFLGYVLLFRSAAHLSAQSAVFRRLMGFSRSLILFSAGLYVLDLLGISKNLGMLGHFLSLFCTAAGLYAAYLLTRALFELQLQRGAELHAKPLHTAWSLLAVCQMVGYLFLMNVLLSTIFSLASLVASIYYLYRFSCCSRAYLGRE